MISLQHCRSCSAVQYPPRELCVACLADTLEWHAKDYEAGEVLATAVLHHSHASTFRDRLPIRIGLVRLDAGPTAVCFLAEGCTTGARVSVTAGIDNEGRTVLSAIGATGSFRAIRQGES